ncbi:MAG: M20 family metallopeptidase [Pseudophaeobacter sp. bin_em_oilr2.035]|uniref:M20 family metallopeptidase n=1 Tax=Phaeobacter gallaeciensis TaxID=60890 RepID=A0ABD4X502_9RHOB|nr:M20 aminoacylase family protein [Phaeobacter gallaeciensis]MDF1770619.1 M20 family metallopeptidase [Pseudophaeobacter sp. bin_em_oilr2.035]MDE4143043.1 M20 family metallopeptidase [Phaeobacter gallaeciensis]MDE4156595.1 M20 family metallopeptidase [Phaeobacter gallaeciensis]MDE4160782.1 M20 family metallopeptidase [Phaeobacter gallaeciensis]MDE4164124.1 M20 family metallopeptidase [Phaeobacter gallaeciensis]
MPVKNRAAEFQKEVAAWRRDIHENPEILYDTHRTSALVAEKLKEFGCDEVVTGIGRTGVVAVIRGKSDSKGRAIGLRADMDALPMQEQTGLPHASKIPNAMHACGHDGHTAMLLGAAKYLAETRNFDGTAVMIFQPAEEGGNGGEAMVKDGMMERFGIDEVYAIHNSPGIEAGTFAIRPGPILASVDEFTLHLSGRGGHGAKPNMTVDTTVMMCHMITALQTIVSRNMDPVEKAVMSLTSAETSSKAFNVIPDKAEVRGTIRTHSEDVRAMIPKRIKEIAEGVAETFGGSVELEMRIGVPVTINDDAATEYARAAAQAVGICEDVPILMGGEDFSFMLQERPGAMIRLGNGPSAGLHHPEYDFNDEIIPAGISWFAEIVESRMPAA